MAAIYTNNYMVGQYRNDLLNDREKEVFANVPYILESYHYVKQQKYVDALRLNNAKVFLDSGAFSAHTLNADLNVPEYVDYIQRNKDILSIDDNIVLASVLDGIGNAEETYHNQKWMEYLGFSPLPCFHAGEPDRFLEYYISNYDYITLGGMVGASTKQLTIWLDRVWNNYLVDGSGRPKLKVHGFGITAIELMKRYPWYSCDSSSWVQTAAYGAIVLPEFGTLDISDKNSSKHQIWQHAMTLTKIEQNILFESLESQGFTYERLSQYYVSRAAFNVLAYGILNETFNKTLKNTIPVKIQELF